MAIAYDTSTANAFTASATSTTFSHTCTGSDLILWVGVSIRPTRTISSVTYNGVTMTQSGNNSFTGAVDNYLYYLVNPATGANDVVVTQSASDTFNTCSISFTGASQSVQPDATSEVNSTTTTSFSQSVTSVADNTAAVIYGDAASGSALTAGANTTIVNQPEVLFTGAFLLRSTADKTPAGTFTLAATSASQTFGACMATIKPSAASFTPSPAMHLRQLM